MKSSDFLLLFLIIYNIFLTFIFLIKFYKFKRVNSENDKYIEELIFELAKMRRK